MSKARQSARGQDCALRRDDITPQVMQVLFDYSPVTGVLTRRSNGRRVGTTINSSGYYVFSLKKMQFYVHRAAWACFHGKWPDGVIDHINRDKLDNRISNLRDVDNRENLRNQARSRANKSGVCGVHFCSRYRLWVAQITGDDGKHISLGRFDTRAEAAAARRAAEICLGYSPLHGKSKREAGHV